MITQGTSYTLMFPAVDASDPTKRLASPTFSAGDVMITKPGASGVASTNTPTHNGRGQCQVVLTASDLNLGLTDGQVGEVMVDITHAGMVPLLGVTLEIQANAPGTLTVSERGSVASALWAVVSDGAPIIQRLTVAIAALLNKATLPSTGAQTVRDAADTKNRLVASIDASGNRVITSVDGA